MNGRGVASGTLMLFRCTMVEILETEGERCSLCLRGVGGEGEGRAGVEVVGLLGGGFDHWVGVSMGRNFGRLFGPLLPRMSGESTLLKHCLC